MSNSFLEEIDSYCAIVLNKHGTNYIVQPLTIYAVGYLYSKTCPPTLQCE